MGAVKEPVDDVAELLEHPLAIMGLAGLPADAGHELLGGKADDRRHGHGQHGGAVLAVGVGGRPHDEDRKQVEEPDAGDDDGQVTA